MLEMEGEGAMFMSPELRPLFVKGDCVQVFEGTGSGRVKNRSVGWFGKVLGMKEGKYLVRNRILAGKESPALIEGEYLTLQRDFGLGLGTGERAQFRTLSKRSRSRIEESADRRNAYVLKEAHKEIKKLKTKNTMETEAHRERLEKTQEQGKALVSQANVNHNGDLEFWKKKWCRSETKMAQQRQEHKTALAKYLEKHQQHEVSLYLLHFFCVSMHAFTDFFYLFLLCSLGQKHSTKQKWNHFTTSFKHLKQHR